MKFTFLLFALLLAFPLAWADDDYTLIDSCGYVIDEPGHYVLAGNLENCATPFFPGDILVGGVAIISSDVVLDLDGHTISCAQLFPEFNPDESLKSLSFGIFSGFGNNRVKVMNGTVTNCFLGVELDRNDKAMVRDMTLAENLFGMEIIDGSKAKVMHNEIVGVQFSEWNWRNILAENPRRISDGYKNLGCR